MKRKLLVVPVLLSASLLTGCVLNPNNNNVSTPSTTKPATNVKEDIKTDASALLNAVLTKNDSKFKSIYLMDYDEWTENHVIPVQAAEIVKDEDYSPEGEYTVQWVQEFPTETPTETVSNFLKARRNLMKDIKDYKIKSVIVNKDESEATVTFESRKLHNLETATSVRTVLTTVIGGLENLSAYNTSGAVDVTTGKYQSLLQFWLYNHLFEGHLNMYQDVDSRLSYTPLTQEIQEIEFTMTKDNVGNWVVTPEAYRDLMSELIDRDADYGTAVYAQELGLDITENSSDDETTTKSSNL
jgi:hypothetical protein